MSGITIACTKFKSAYVQKGTQDLIDLESWIQTPVTGEKKKKLPIVRFWLDNEDRHPTPDQRYTAVVLDIDKSQVGSLQAVAKQLQRYTHVIHTTSSHTSTVESFRLILPLRYPRTHRQIRYLTDQIIASLEVVDVSVDPRCLEASRGFYAPAWTPDYQMRKNVATELDLEHMDGLLLCKKGEQIQEEEKAIPETKEKIEPVKLQLNKLTSDIGHIDSIASMRELWARPQIQLSVITALGYVPDDLVLRENDRGLVSPPLRSPLLSHVDTHPSWTLLYDADRQSKFVFYSHAAQLTLDPIDIYYRNHTGNDEVLTGPSREVWLTRMLTDVGLVTPADIQLSSLPESASGSLRRLWNGIGHLFGVKWATEFGASSVLACRFLADWCGISVGSVSTGLRELAKLGLLLPSETFVSRSSIQMRTWLPQMNAYSTMRG